jgi:hypothetical protein
MREAYDFRMPTEPHVGGFNVVGVAYLVLVIAVIFLPVLVWRGSSSNDDDDGRDEGRGGGPEPPSPRPPGPSGGIPLPDAEPARRRLRGYGRITDGRPPRSRRSSPHPAPGRQRPRV